MKSDDELVDEACECQAVWDSNKLKKVKAVQDNDCHWYLIPNELINDFYEDLDNDQFDTIVSMDDLYSKYKTGGDLNLVQLYIK